MNNNAAVIGHKGGGGHQHTPVESPDSLHSLSRARILLALGEGEFEGFADDHALRRAVYLDGTPIQNSDGSENFPTAKVQFRPGTQGQAPINGFSAAESETAVNVDLKHATPWIKEFSNLELDAVRIRLGFPLMEVQQNNGDTVGADVRYMIELAVDGGAYRKIGDFRAKGKTTSLYERDHRINLPQTATANWRIRVTRTTPDSTDQKVMNAVKVEAYTEIVDARFRYPLTALLFVEFDAKAFSSIPQVSIKAKGRKILVPSNYDPVARTYNGDWDGTFKRAWSNNPAWVFYDVATTARFGLGKRIKPAMLNRYMLYQIAKRCDERVPDGKGGTEPRHLYDAYIQSQEEAWTVLKDICAIFAGMTYWGASTLNVVSDQPVTEVAHIVTNASVVDGKISYAGASQKTHYSTYAVSYSDPANHYNSAVAAGQRAELVRRFKINPLSITAIGCTRESEAQRRGNWALLSNLLDRQITFQVGHEGILFRPGMVIGVADYRISGGKEMRGGRCVSGNGNTVECDREPTLTTGDAFLVRTANGELERHVISGKDGRTVHLATPLHAEVPANAIFVIDSPALQVQTCRIVSVTFDDDSGTYTVHAVEYNESKYDAVDKGARLDQQILTRVPDNVQRGPASVTVTGREALVQGKRETTAHISWPKAPGAVQYEVQVQRSSGNSTTATAEDWGTDWVNLPATATTSVDVRDVFAGWWAARVRAVGRGGVSSAWVESTPVHLTGRVGAVPAPISLAGTKAQYGIVWHWAFAPDTEDTQQTEIQYQALADATAQPGVNWLPLTVVAYPGHTYAQMGLGIGQYIAVRARCADKLGNQSAWTAPAIMHANEVVSDYIKDLDAEIQKSAAFKEISTKIDTDLAAVGKQMTALGAKVDTAVRDVDGVKGTVQTISGTVNQQGNHITTLQQTVQTQADAMGAAVVTMLSNGFNLFPDGSLESYADNAALVRATQDHHYTHATLVTSGAYQGSKSMRIELNPAGNSDLPFLTTPVVALENDRYFISYVAKVGSGAITATTLFRAGIQCLDSAGHQISVATIEARAENGLTGAWKTFSGIIKIPVGTRLIRPYFYCIPGATPFAAGTNIWIDAIVMEKVEQAQQAADKAGTALTTATGAQTAANTAKETADAAKAAVATVQATASAVQNKMGTYDATWTVKAQVDASGHAYMAAISAGVSASSDGTHYKGSVLVNAHNFAVYVPSTTATAGPLKAMFIVDAHGAWMQGAFIQDATITGAKIANATISGAKIANATIANGHITGTLASQANTPGHSWSLTQQGILTCSGATIHGTVTATGGVLDHVTINGTCTIKGTLHASQITGDVATAYSVGNGQSVTVPADAEMVREIYLLPMYICYNQSSLANESGSIYATIKIGSAAAVTVNVQANNKSALSSLNGGVWTLPKGQTAVLTFSNANKNHATSFTTVAQFLVAKAR